jgi:hypothetical protein
LKKTRRALQLFLVYALLWPISLGDKMVRLDAPTAESACSGPWSFYRDLGTSLFGTSTPMKSPGSIRQDTDMEPALLPVTNAGRAQAAPCRRPAGPIRSFPLHRHKPGFRLLILPPPPLAFKVDSKE